MKSLMVALMLSASAVAGLAGTALAATGAPTPPVAIAQPNRSGAAAPSNPMPGAGMMPGGMMAFRGRQSRMMDSMLAMMRMMGTGPNMAGFMAGSPMMGGSSAGSAGPHAPSH